MSENTLTWHQFVTRDDAVVPVQCLKQQFDLLQLHTFPRSDQLNKMWANANTDRVLAPLFEDQGKVPDDIGYYEEIIHNHGIVPTREDSWHDLFNALIWMQFPNVKTQLNVLHMEDIRAFGSHPRTQRRHHLTHFDECGVVLAIPKSQIQLGNEMLEALANHEWKNVFISKQAEWGRVIFPIVFGHANYEMMLNPYEGLTGKWLAVSVDDQFEEASFAERSAMLDCAIVERITQLEGLGVPHVLRPLPLLGVPGWFANQTEAFYNNQDYFRPRRQNNALPAQIYVT